MIIKEGMMSSFSIRIHKERNVSKLISSNTRSSMSNGIKTFSRPKKKMLKPLVSLKIDTPKKLSRTDRFLKRSFH